MSIQENTLVFRRSLLHLVVIGSIIHQSISFLSRGHSTPLCPALPCVTLLREALVYFYLQKLVPIQPKTSNILPKICEKLTTTLRVPTEVCSLFSTCCRRSRNDPRSWRATSFFLLFFFAIGSSKKESFHGYQLRSNLLRNPERAIVKILLPVRRMFLSSRYFGLRQSLAAKKMKT